MISMLRFGLCCIFVREPISFRRTTARHLSRLPRAEQLARLAAIARDNAAALQAALEFCRRHGIGAFRINSQILPLKTHPEAGYGVADLPGHREIVAAFQACGRFARENDLRTTFHPDQFVVLASPRRDVVEKSRADLAYHAEVAEWVHADAVNIHAGGVYGDKIRTLHRLRRVIDRLPAAVRRRLTLENDDRSYTPADLLPVCRDTAVPFVYDVHHHRCLPDRLTVADATRQALATWNREPLFHVSSPASGWNGSDPRPHHDYINPDDLPQEWRDLDITVEVEAKAKELAVLQLMRDTGKRRNKERH